MVIFCAAPKKARNITFWRRLPIASKSCRVVGVRARLAGAGNDRHGNDRRRSCVVVLLRDNHLGRCRNITSHPARSAPGHSGTAHPRHHALAIDHTVGSLRVSLHTAHCTGLAARACGVRYERRCIGGRRHWHSARSRPRNS